MLSEEDFKYIFTVEVDNKLLSDLIDELSTDEIYAEIVEDLVELDIRYGDVADELALSLAEKLQSNVKDTIESTGSIATGLMFHNVNIIEEDFNSQMVELDAHSEEGTFYPAIIEEGREEIIAPDGGVLAFYPTGGYGEIVFAKKIKAVPPKPFWQPAVIQTEAELNLLVEQGLISV